MSARVYPNHAEKLFRQPLLVLDSTRVHFERQLLSRMGLVELPARASDDDRPASPGQRAQWRVDNILKDYGRVAVIKLDGVVDKRLSDYEMDCYGGLDLSDVDAAIAQVGSRPKIETVVFDIHSPGGGVVGVAETAARIKQLGAYKNAGGFAKETRAFIDVQACSAAYWLASQCDQIDAAPSAHVGSIGVYCALLDESRALEMEGYKVNLIKAGKLKAAGASFQELTKDEREMFQERVDAIWSEFKGAVTSMRPKVSEDSMQGQSFRASEGKQLGLVDAITNESLDEFVSRLLSR